jgi:hypothetical protein
MAVKLPLAVRKDVRDSWEAVIPAYTERMKKCTGEDYTMEPNIEALYAAAADTENATRVICTSFHPLLSLLITNVLDRATRRRVLRPALAGGRVIH